MLKYVKAFISHIYEKSFQGSLFRMDRAAREAILASFPEPADRIERSFFQYRCHMQSVSPLLRFAQSLISYPALLILLLVGVGNERTPKAEASAVYISYGIGKEIIPRSVYGQYPDIVQINDTPLLLTKKERAWFAPVCKRYWKHPYFLLKCYTKVGVYAAIRRLYQPKAIIAYSEFSFTSSVLTDYCEHIGLQHINVLHGEKMLNTRDSFVSYHRFYVWNDGYRDMFIRMRAQKDQFLVEQPPMLRLKLQENIPQVYDLTYYAGNLTKEQLGRLRPMLVSLQREGRKICIRLHPRFGNRESFQNLPAGFVLEDPAEVTIEESLAKTKYCCAAVSTVLYQAVNCGKPIVIDDISDPLKYAFMKDLDCQILKYPYQLLSGETN